MKKFYAFFLAAAAALSANAASSQLYIMGNPAGGWNYNQGVEMTQTEAGVFTYELHATSAQWFAFTDLLGSTWDETNAHRYAPAGANNTVPAGDTNAMSYGKDASWQLPAGDYTLTVNTNTMNLAVGGIVDTKIGDLYLRGAISNWEAQPAYAFTTTDDNVWTLTVDAIEAGSEFKIGSSDWAYSFSSQETAMVLNTPYTCVEGGEDNNMALAAAATNVTFTFTVDTKTLVITGEDTPVPPTPVATPDALYIVGNVNGNTWDTTAGVALEKADNKFTVKNVQIDDAGEGFGYFTFVTTLGADWDAVNSADRFGATAPDAVITKTEAVPFILFAANVNASAANSWKAEAGKYDFVVDFETMTVAMSESQSGIEAIEAEAAEAEYYNLQGVRVVKPENGLYIEVRGKKASKVYIR